MNIFFKISIPLLAILAVVLGYSVYVRDFKYTLSGSPTGQPAVDSQNQIGDSAVPSSSLVGVEVKALQSPPANATLVEQLAFADFLKNAAQPAAFLELGEACVAKPVVLSIKIGFPLKIKNTSSVEQIVIFSDKDSFRVPAESTKEFKLGFATKGGIFVYGCASVKGVAGRIVVTD